MNINFFTNIFSNLNFGATQKGAPSQARKKLNPSQVIRREAEDLFEQRYQICSDKMQAAHIKHEKPLLKFMNNQYEASSGFYYIGDNSLHLNIAAFNHLNLVDIRDTWRKRPIFALLTNAEIRECLRDKVFEESEIKVSPLGGPERRLLLESTIDHELEHFIHFHKLLNSRDGRDKFIRKGMKHVEPRDMPYLLRFQPDVRFSLSDGVSVPRSKLYRRAQFNGFDILASMCKGSDYKASATEILARMQEIATIDRRLSEGKLSETEKGTLLALKEENAEILKKDCL